MDLRCWRWRGTPRRSHALCAEIAEAGGRARRRRCRVTRSPRPGDVVTRAMAMGGGITALVNAAGIIASGAVGDTTDAGWDAMMDINVRAPFRLIRAAVPALTTSKGAVVNVSSVTGTRAFPGVAAYCVSKAAVDQLTRVAALDLAPAGVRVNAVNPGVVVTNLHRRSGMDEARYAEFLERSKATHPLGPRPVTPDEIAASHRISGLAGVGVDHRGDDRDRRRDGTDVLSLIDGLPFTHWRLAINRLPIADCACSTDCASTDANTHRMSIAECPSGVPIADVSAIADSPIADYRLTAAE